MDDPSLTDHILPIPTSSQHPIVTFTTDAINNNNSKHQPNRNKVVVVACRKSLKGFINAHKQTYFNVYYWSRVVFIHILPCVSLVLLNAALIGALRKASARRRRLLHYGDNKKSITVEANHREELVCVLEPKKSLRCSMKNEDKSLARDDRSFAVKNLGETDAQGMSSQEKDIKNHPLAEANDQTSRYHVISVAMNDQNPASNIANVPKSGSRNSKNIMNDGNDTNAKPDNKNPHRQQGCQESRLRSNSGVRTFSVGSVALKEAKRFKTKHKASVSMVAKKNKQRRQAECNCTTLMLVVVVGLFLLVEVPLAALFVLQIIDNTFELNIINYSSGQIVTWVINMLILVGYSVNFVVYCAMNREFRSTFRERILSYIFFCGQDSFPVSCGVKEESSSSKTQEVERIALPTRTISGFFHYGKPHSRRHRSFFHMSPKNRSYIKDKMASSISPAT